MESHLADWYAETDLTGNSDTLERRKEGVAECCKWINADHAIDLARLIVQDLTPTSNFHVKFCTFFKEADDSFRSKGNDFELAVLAAAVAELELHDASESSHLLALSLVCAGFAEHKRTPPISSILQIAEDYLATHSLQRSSALKPAETDEPTLDLKDKLDELKTALTANESSQVADILPPLITKLTEAIETGDDSISHRLDLVSEECNILWWLYGQCSHDLDVSMTDVPDESTPIIAGKELADLVNTLPGPSAAKQFLAHALSNNMSGSSKTLTLSAAVNALSRDWREKYIASTTPQTLGNTMPLHLAIRISLETHGADEWWPVYTKRTEIPESAEFGALALAVQAYREALLFRHLYPKDEAPR